MKKDTIPHNFGGLSKQYSDYSDSAIVVLPIPFDRTSTWIKGSRRGPDAIIKASGHMELYDIETNSEVFKRGIHTLERVTATTSRSMIRKSLNVVQRLLTDNKFVVILGGEHTVSLGPVMAYSSFFDDFSILHLDAHSDLRDSYEGSPYSHACVMTRAKEYAKDIVSVGIRSMDSSELSQLDTHKIVYASDIYRRKGWISKVISMLTKNVYITIDLDVFDPSIMPSTGTPEPGGLGWYEVMDLCEHVMRKKSVVGFDVVELCPSQNRAPDFLAAKLIYRLLSLKFS